MSVCQTALNVPIWSVDSQENNWNCCQLATRSHIFKLQFNAPNSISVGSLLQTPLGHWGELTVLPRPPTWIFGVLLLREARGGEEAKKGKEGRERKGEGKGGRPRPPPSKFVRHWVRRALRSVQDSRWPDLAWGFSDLEMTWLLYCAGAATPQEVIEANGHVRLSHSKNSWNICQKMFTLAIQKISLSTVHHWCIVQEH